MQQTINEAEVATPAPRSPVFNATIPVHSVQDDNATVVITEVPWGVHATGSSKRNPTDEKDYARAYRIALGRALQRLGRNILKAEHSKEF